jgi:hypothetical protein
MVTKGPGGFAREVNPLVGSNHQHVCIANAGRESNEASGEHDDWETSEREGS